MSAAPSSAHAQLSIDTQGGSTDDADTSCTHNTVNWGNPVQSNLRRAGLGPASTMYAHCCRLRVRKGTARQLTDRRTWGICSAAMCFM